MASMTDFFTREKANEGKKIFLTLPDGTPTEEYLIIRGIDSDHYQATNNEVMRNFMLKSSQDEEYSELEARLDIWVSLVAGWSFEQACTPENIKQLLREAPQIAKKVDELSSNRNFFFGKEQSN
ncbi:hypothetical protein H0A36_24105 [Endozoicomonas sp. SM1973]|uniref:Tail assembly chaperone n=1 Tax=Spartinivicinus marinus TaxID=2994442 RepID=A0A853IEZ9_9GAMM|nr:hypothetical protein [Spartinivicinus marinus]NYZ69108.1 hypothetical protein [Spartinivicinus marinus]